MKIDKQDFKIKMLNWANQFNIFCLLDNNGYDFHSPAFECLLAVGAERSYTFTGNADLAFLQLFHQEKPSWLFGHLGYNALNNAYSNNEKAEIGFGKGFFFEPAIIIKYTADKIEIVKSDRDEKVILLDIENYSNSLHSYENKFNIFPNFSKEIYLEKIKQIQLHILKGDCYELNFCQSFSVDNVHINPVEKYIQLTKVSPAPFGAFYKLNNHYCLCASPERFLQKKGTRLISQPIKGTSRRDIDAVIDESNKQYLLQSKKEKSENVMVVDLVRNDMSMVCEKGTVFVNELFGIYSFPQVHQMISTIEGAVSNNFPFTKIIEACFPMGSMTGAPKKKVMELIEQYEETARGLFSGSIGYITPDADFDFNVVIRSIFYNQMKKSISLFAGSGITFYSKADEEYDECMAKAESLINILTK